MKGVVYIDQNFAEFIPQFIIDRKKDVADIRGFIEIGNFEATHEIFKIIRETANIFGFKALTSMSSHALTLVKKAKGEQAIELVEKMEKHLEKIKVVYVQYDEENLASYMYSDKEF